MRNDFDGIEHSVLEVPLVYVVVVDDFERSITASLTLLLKWLSHMDDGFVVVVVVVDTVVATDDEAFSKTLSLELFNEAKLANSLLKLFDDRFNLDIDGLPRSLLCILLNIEIDS